MISAGDFRNGVTFEMDGEVFRVVEFQHVKPGKGSAFVRTKYQNIKTGATVERSFNPNDRFPSVRLEYSDLEYLYNDGSLYYFMDSESYEQVPIGADLLEDTLPYLKENMHCKIISYQGEIFQVEPPLHVDLQIVRTDPGVRGNTASNAMKTATLETGFDIRVPLFIEQGEVVRVDTRTGEYMERA